MAGPSTIEANTDVAKRSSKAFRRDLLLYVAIAFLVVTITLGLAVLTAKTGEALDPVFLNWIGLGGVMIVVYATAIHSYRAMWKNTRFWLGIALAIVLETGIGALALWRLPRISVGVWGLLVYPGNLVTVDAFLTRWLAASRAS